MLNFSYANPTRLVFGRSAEHEVGRVMTSILGRPGKVLVLFGGGSAHRTGILGAVEDSLQESGFAVIEMGGVQPNPRMGFVRDTIDWVRDQGIRAVVAVGGGSVIDNTFKNEPSYKVKIAKLENLDAKRIEINRLIVEVEKLLDRERTPFFAQVPDEELLTIARELKTELLSAGHSLIHSQQDIIDYLNQIRTQVGFTRKLRRIKYLREQFELQENTNVREVVDAERSVVLEGVQPTLFKISIPYLQTDEALDVILKVADGIRPDKVIHRQELGVISAEQMENQEVGEAAINTRKMMDVFSRTGGDLFSFVMGYEYNREMDFEAKVTLFCRLLSLYENELEITDRFGHTEHIEYAIIQRT